MGTTAATGELATAGVSAALFTGIPLLGIVVIMTAAVATARVTRVMAPVISPVRKLTSSSRALMAVRMPDHGPAVRCLPPFTRSHDTDKGQSTLGKIGNFRAPHEKGLAAGPCSRPCRLPSRRMRGYQ